MQSSFVLQSLQFPGAFNLIETALVQDEISILEVMRLSQKRCRTVLLSPNQDCWDQPRFGVSANLGVPTAFSK